MKQIQNAILLTAITIVFFACGNSEKNGADGKLGEKKVELQKLKTEKSTLDQKIMALEKDIAKLDTASTDQPAKLVALSPLKKENFNHYLELQGKVDD